jgi:hypothetical protein
VDVEVALPPSSTAAAGKQAKSSSSSKDKRNETLFPHQQQRQQYDDYLQEQREEREQNLHAARVDHMLQKCTQQVRSCHQCCCCCLTLVFVKTFLYYFCVQPIQYSALLSSRRPGSASSGPGGVAVGVGASSAHGDDPRSPSQASQVSRQSAASSHRTRASLHLHAEHSSVACGVDDVPLFNEVQ